MNLSDSLDLVDFAILLKTAIERQIDKNHPQLATIKKTWDFVSRFQAAGISYKHDAGEQKTSKTVQDFVFSLADTIRALRCLDVDGKNKKDGLVILIDEVDKASPNLHLGSFLKNLTESLAAG